MGLLVGSFDTGVDEILCSTDILGAVDTVGPAEIVGDDDDEICLFVGVVEED